MLNSDGTTDLTYDPQLIFDGVFSGGDNTSVKIDESGFEVLATFTEPGVQSSFLSLLDSTGSEIAGFQRLAGNNFVVDSGETILHFEEDPGSVTRGVLTRYTRQGILDSTVAPISFELAEPGTGQTDAQEIFLFRADELPDGRIIIGGAFDTADGESGFDTYALLTSEGELDARFKPSFTGGSEFIGTFASFTPLPENRLFALGNFEVVNGINLATPGIARITLPEPRSPVSTYAEFVAARLPSGSDTAPDGDADGDGIPNLIEYATGETAEPIVLTPAAGGRPSVTVASAARADVVITLEASTDGTLWEVVIPPLEPTAPTTLYRLRAVLNPAQNQ